MLRRESYLTFPDQKDANARFYTRVGTPKYLITKPIENHEINEKVLFLCLVLNSLFRKTEERYIFRANADSTR